MKLQTATFTANSDGTFTVQDTTSTEGADFMMGWDEDIQPGPTALWLVETVSCN